ncbi:unnamed protein product [Rhodiola kirilowii]
MSNLAQTVFELKRDPGKLPSQTVPNPRGNVNALAVVNVDAALKESAYWVNKMLALDETEVKNSENELESVPIASEGDISTTLMSEADDPITLRPDAPLTSTADATHADMNPKSDPFPSFSMQAIAPKDHVIDKDERGGRL